MLELFDFKSFVADLSREPYLLLIISKLKVEFYIFKDEKGAFGRI